MTGGIILAIMWVVIRVNVYEEDGAATGAVTTASMTGEGIYGAWSTTGSKWVLIRKKRALSGDPNDWV
jgi:hypothetical protein